MPGSPAASPPLDAAPRRGRLRVTVSTCRVVPLTAGGILVAGSLLAAQATPAATSDPADEIAAAEEAGSQLLFDYDFDAAIRQ